MRRLSSLQKFNKEKTRPKDVFDQGSLIEIILLLQLMHRKEIDLISSKNSKSHR